MESMHIIAYSPEFEERVSDQILPIQREEFGIEITAEDQPDLRTIPEVYQQGAGNFWLAVEDGRVLGTIALIDIGSSQLALRKMFVERDARGSSRGIARRLLDTALGWAERQGMQQIFLGTTPVLHGAHRFYEKNGFIELAKTELPSAFPVMAIDSKFYRYDVADRAEALSIRVREEIESLHSFFVGWFSGALPEHVLTAQFLDRFDPDFLLVPPAGTRLSVADLAGSLRAKHASNPAFRVAIRNVEIKRSFEGHVLATYEEWQRHALASKPPDNGRLATVLFETREPLRWLHIHETWLPEDVQRAGPYDF
jgi:N-acetylglutamate synthase-like GNAT family acetyltransferase